MFNKKTLFTGIIAILLIAFGATAVLAQNGEPEDPLSPHDAQQARLAEALGISVEELQAAQQAAEIARITQAVEDGVISTDQGNFMLAMIYLKDTLDRGEMLASALDISVEEVEAAIEEGTLRELLAEVTPAELREGLQDAFDQALEEAIEEMLITEEQADMVREHFGDGFRFFHLPHYGPHGPWGRHGRFYR